MDFQLAYGREKISFRLPEEAQILEYKSPVRDIHKVVFQSEFSQLLPNEKERYSNIAIVVSDKTRLCGYPEFLPWITDILLEKGALAENICFYIAYGTHPKQSETESEICYGAVYKSFKFIHHQCDQADLFKMIGITKRGTPVSVRHDILESTLLITFGSISHHYFAGFGGGRKLLFPGLAARNAIYHNHGLFLDKKTKSLAESCQPGILDENPLAEDLKEIDSLLPARISIHAIMNDAGKPCKLLIGNSYDDFLKACKLHDQYYKYPSDEKFDLVIASSGGYPKDINFIQAHKSVHHAAAFVRDGGTLILLSECADGIGSNYFLKYLEAGSFEAAFEILESNYEGNGGTALSMMLKTRRIRIFMHTSLPDNICKMLGVIKMNPSGIQKILDEDNHKIAVIRNASILVK